MDKFSQKRGLLNELREKINMPGSYLEGFFKPELDRVMVSLKLLDDKIRSELTGKKIGEAEDPQISISAKDLLKTARTNFNRREYITGVADLGMFHKKMQDVVSDIDKFFVDVNKIHHKFLFEGVDDEKIKQLRQHMEGKIAVDISNQFVKEAGIMDFFYNIGTKRGRSLAAWEKKYPKETKSLREGGSKLLDMADDLLAKTISILKEMATARAVRRPDDYMDAANKIKIEFSKFENGDRGFRAYYNNAILPFMKIKDDIERQPVQLLTPTINTPPIEPVKESPPPPPPQPAGSPTLGGPPGASPPFTPPNEEQAPDTERNPKVRINTQEEPKIRVAHVNFFRSLESMSQEDPMVLASYIAKYATSIQKNDMETAVKLFSIVKRLKG